MKEQLQSKERTFLVIGNGDGEDQRIVKGLLQEILNAFVEINWVGEVDEGFKDAQIAAYVEGIREEWEQWDHASNPFRWDEKGEQCFFEIREIIADMGK